MNLFQSIIANPALDLSRFLDASPQAFCICHADALKSTKTRVVLTIECGWTGAEIRMTVSSKGEVFPAASPGAIKDWIKTEMMKPYPNS